MNGSGPVRPLGADDALEAALLHAAAMLEPWSEAAWRGLLADPAVVGLGAGIGAGELERLAGALLLRCVADEAEILTVCVAPAERRRGLGRALVSSALDSAARQGVHRVFLEVAVDNAAALSLYRSIGFTEVGRRRGYYGRPEGRVDALLLARTIAQDEGRSGGGAT